MRNWRILLTLAVAGLLAPGARAGTGAPAVYSNGINESSWRADVSVFECRLVQAVPFYGDAVFRTRAGEASGFYLRAQSSRFSAGKAKLQSVSPLWRPEQDVIALGEVPVKQGRRPMWLDSAKAEKLLAELNRGREIQFVRDAWYEQSDNSPVQLSLNTIGFRAEYRRYLGCLSTLLPANFDQMKRTSLYFGPQPLAEEDELDPQIRRQLDNMLKLVKHDAKIREFYIDGHASSPGTREENLELSKARAEKVATYLKQRGIPEAWITTRWHGERYPIASNASAAGRAKNRRVTVRMERMEAIKVLPLAQK